MVVLYASPQLLKSQRLLLLLLVQANDAIGFEG